MRAEDREEPDDSPVTSGPDTSQTRLYWRANIRTDVRPAVSVEQVGDVSDDLLGGVADGDTR
jgi:hypothetical protein